MTAVADTALCEAAPCNPGRHLAGCDDDTCPGCQPRPAQPGLRTCQQCLARIRKQLQEIPARWNTCQQSLPAATGRTAFITGSRNPPLPLDLNISARLDKAKRILTGWAKVVITERGFTTYPADDVKRIAAFLGANAEWLAAHPAAKDITHEIHEAWNALRPRDTPRDRSTIKVGPCPEQTHGQPCTGNIWAYIPTSEQDPAVMNCDNCNHTWTTDQWLRLGRRILATNSR